MKQLASIAGCLLSPDFSSTCLLFCCHKVGDKERQNTEGTGTAKANRLLQYFTSAEGQLSIFHS